MSNLLIKLGISIFLTLSFVFFSWLLSWSYPGPEDTWNFWRAFGVGFSVLGFIRLFGYTFWSGVVTRQYVVEVIGE